MKSLDKVKSIDKEIMGKDIEAQILKYEKFVNDTLKPKLKNELDLRDKIYDEISE